MNGIRAISNPFRSDLKCSGRSCLDSHYLSMLPSILLDPIPNEVDSLTTLELAKACRLKLRDDRTALDLL